MDCQNDEDEWTSITDDVPGEGDQVEVRFDSIQTQSGELRIAKGDVTNTFPELGAFELSADETYDDGSEKVFHVGALVKQVTRSGEERRASRPTVRRPEFRVVD